MAHGDYNCCAICDCKLEYAGIYATTKDRICERCLLKLQKMNLPIVTVEQLIDWIRNENVEVLEQKLKSLDFHACYYANDVDNALTEKGIAFNSKTGLIK